MADHRRRKPQAGPPDLAADDEDLIRNAADKEQVKSASKKEKDDDFDRLENVRYLLQFPQFRDFVWRLMAHCRTFEATFHPDPYQHAFNAGTREVGNYVNVSLMEADPDAFIKLIDEHRKETK